MERHKAPYITQALALAWAQQPVDVQPSTWARRFSVVRDFARYRSAADRRTQIPAPGNGPSAMADDDARKSKGFAAVSAEAGPPISLL
jgi:hypothetical protein